MSLTPYVTCLSSGTGFCSHNAWIGGTLAAKPTEEPADFWELEVGRMLFVLPMKCCSATTSTEGCLLSFTAWTKKNWGRKWQQLSAHFALFGCFKVCRSGTFAWSHIFNCLDCTFNPVLRIWLCFLSFTYILAHLMCSSSFSLGRRIETGSKLPPLWRPY